MRKRLAVIATCLAVLCSAGTAQALDKVRTNSISAYTGFSIYAADKLGYFKEFGIDTQPRFFPSGAPIVQSAAAGEWDITFLGAPPTVLASPQLGLVTVGMVAEEGSMHELIGRPDFVEKVKADRSALKGARIFVTTLSTGHYMTEACLGKFGLTPNDVRIIPSDQQATMSAFTAGQGDLAQLWSPGTTTLRARGNKVLCDAVETKLSMPGVWVVHPNFKGKSDVIRRWIQANLKAIDWMKKNPEKTFDLYKEYDAYRGFNFSNEQLRADVKLVLDTYMGLDEQLAMLKAKDGDKPRIATAFEEIAGFFIRQGRMSKTPDYRPFIDASHLEAIAKK